MNLRVFLLIVGLSVSLAVGAAGAPPAIGMPGAMPCLSRGCDMNSGPVCTVDDSGVPVTFENRCMAEVASCRFGIYYAVVKQGEC